tara:strand:- start:129 stop:323 length:195 start_codon:yes stop_codon:yes gene_type:complete
MELSKTDMIKEINLLAQGLSEQDLKALMAMTDQEVKAIYTSAISSIKKAGGGMIDKAILYPPRN